MPLYNDDQLLRAGYHAGQAGKAAEVAYYMARHSEDSAAYHAKDLRESLERAANALGFDLVERNADEEKEAA